MKVLRSCWVNFLHNRTLSIIHDKKPLRWWENDTINKQTKRLWERQNWLLYAWVNIHLLANRQQTH